MALNKNVWFWTIALSIFAIDIFTKVLVRTYMHLGESIRLLPFLNLTHTENIGVAFGLLQFEAFRWILAAITLAVIIVILVYYKKIPNEKIIIVSAALILAGAAGNLIDRVLYGAVTDFIDFIIWPAFNMADSALTVGIILLIWKSLKEK